MAQPVRVAAHVRHADEPAGAAARTCGPATSCFTGVPAPPAGLHVEVEHLLPHRHDVAQVPLLAQILLRDLQLDRLVRLLQPAEQRRRRLAHLEIDRAVLDLDDDVVFEQPVELVEVVVRGGRAVVLEIPPVHLVVVDEPAIEQHAAVRLECPGDRVGGVGGRAAVFGRARAGLRNRP